MGASTPNPSLVQARGIALPRASLAVSPYCSYNFTVNSLRKMSTMRASPHRFARFVAFDDSRNALGFVEVALAARADM
jgi:hypothetical protein